MNIRWFFILIIKTFLWSSSLPSCIGVEPGSGKLSIINYNLTSGILYCLSNCVIYFSGIPSLCFFNICGNMGIFIFGLSLFFNELQHKGSGNNRLCFDGFYRPIVFNLTSYNACNIFLEFHILNLAFLGNVNLQAGFLISL